MTLYKFNKPFNCLSQFTDKNVDSSRETLADYITIKNIYPAGRLDRDSEGLLLLTDNGRLQAKISNPKFRMAKTYFVQVEREITDEAITNLRNGVQLKDGMTRSADAEIVETPDWLWPRTPPIRVRKTVEDSWIKLTIHEGRNRQVRRMTANVGFPTLRLIRTQIGEWNLDQLLPGAIAEVR